MRVLISKHVFAEAQPGVYRHTTISWAICEPDQSHLLKHRLDDCFRSASRQADSLRLNGYREPELGDRCGFSLAFQSDASFWEYITKHDPVRGENFNKAMKSVQINSLSDIPNLYPFDSLAETGGLIVDVGGGHGQVSRAILANYPNSYLRCVVQDRFVASLPTADANGSQTSEVGKVGTGSVTFEKHNFFDPQPIKGAAAYFFRHIFHDWPDSACREILKQTVLAMDTQSRILICDQIVDEKSSSVHSMLYDLDMMSLFGGKERRLSEWEALITEADKRLRITDTKKSSNSPTTILEIRLG
ncbi:unnamed protein product [Clonostachys solani]|uniref:O-methyltransferase C-terminal domain-containing protein n=1 Tax=Clonostachys solani TaxID=160281 RepID=A0A9N9W4R3_9HYPO|nr:unnamed protein product [Clonostachys solani]